MDKPEDILYLKQFVKQHPDNKMGWYLLGKHYLQAGKEAKANYCFIQAGDIYEAFEQETHPLAEEQLEELKEWNEKQKKKRLTRKIVLAAIPLLLLALLLPLNGYIRKDEPAKLPDSVLPQPEVGAVIVPREEGQPLGFALNAIAAAGSEAPGLVYAVHVEEKKGWQHWNGNIRFLMAVGEQEGHRNSLSLNMLDAETCVCEPGDASAAKNRFGTWKEEQETHWTLASGIYHFKKKYGQWPESIDDLTRPYPDNVLSGDGRGMQELFPYLLTKMKAQEKPGGGAAGGTSGSSKGQGNNGGTTPKRSGTVGTNGLIQPDWSQPLEIIIDVANYRLAVVHDKLIVRSYEVGLGGERTPEGNFYISEKVRDPLGEKKGVFGTRGMALSGTQYAIHGTGDPESIGKDKSLGCIRLRNADVEELYDLVPLGTVVKIKNGTLPSDSRQSAEKFRLKPKQNETNPAKVYQWLT